MATQKPDLTRVWANGAPPGNVVDPDTTTPGKVLSGWQAEVPPFEHFNFLQKWFTQGLAHFNEQGIGVWDTDTIYPVNGLSKGSDGIVYKSLQEQSGNNPVTDSGSNWVKTLFSLEDLSKVFNTSFPNVANLKSGTTVGGEVLDFSNLVGATVYWQGYYSANDGGGNFGVVKSGAHTEDGGSIITVGTDLYVESVSPNNVAQWGLPGVDMAFNATQIDKLCDWAYSNSIYVIKCDVDATIDPSAQISNKSNVVFVGSGSLTGLYRVRVHKSQDSIVPKFDNIGQTQLDVFHKSKNPVVVMMGDSISTAGEGAQGPNAVGYGESMWSLITKKIQNDVPDKNVTFYNRGIGGQTWLNANDNTRPSVGVTQWYTVDQAWLDYIEDLEPDLLFLAFGMNDSNGFNAGAMVSTINKINAWNKVPSIVFITTPVPSLATIFPDGTGFGFVGQTFQEGRDQVASYTRSYAEYFDYGYIDINRMFCCVRDGYDPTTSDMRRVDTDVVPTDGVYTDTGGAGTRDFNIVGTIQGTAQDIEDIFNGVNGILTCRVGLNSADLVFLNNSGNDTIQVQLNSSGLNSYDFIDTGIPFPTSDFNLTIDVTNNILTVLLDNTNICTTKLVRQAALFPVQFGYQGFATGPFSLITFSKGLSVTVGKSATDREIWGESDLTADTKFPDGGNGINHYASGGIAKVVLPTLDMTSFVGYESDSAEVSPYPLTINEHFINWSGLEVDNWARQAANFGTETSGGVHGSPTSLTFGLYPTGYAQDITARLSRELSDYKLVLVAKNGASYGTESAGWVNPHNTLIVITWNDGSPQSMTVNFPEHTFESDWSEVVWDVGKFAPQELPPLSQITSIELRVYLTNGGILGYAGVHESDSSRILYKNPLVG